MLTVILLYRYACMHGYVFMYMRVYIYVNVRACLCVYIYVCINHMFDVKSDVLLFVSTNQMFGLFVVYSQSVHYLYFEYEINDK